ncbi:MAG: DNA polymerase III subunit delta [Lachnospiraceae bacterium]|nr:DNA polymerase III subunit delta [Lachnospiraceae bacterium]
MEKIREQEKSNNFDHVYLLYGTEQMVIKIYRNKILKGLLGSDSISELKQDMNFSIFVGTPFDSGEAINMALSYPFMSDKRVILIENVKAFSKDNKALIECVKNLPETTYMIFTETEIENKKGLFAAIKEVGHVVEINEQPRAFVEKWIVRQFSLSDKRISRAAMDELINRAGLDILRLSNEIAKIVAYKGDEMDVMLEDVACLVTEEPSEKVFKMIDGMANRNVEQALKYYYDLLELKVSPQKILPLIERQMKILYQVKDLRKKGFPINTLSSRVKSVSPRFADNYAKQASRFSEQEIIDCIKDCVDYTQESRMGGISDRIAVETIIVKYSTKAKN